MKIKEIYIDNFGKLSNFKVDLTDGCNTIIEENGFGKTTLTKFIKVMFYGFDNEQRKKKEDKERFKYVPWLGGKYGGSIVFEIKGKDYLLRKTFGEDDLDDYAELLDYKTRKPVFDYPTGNLGETLFGIDSESFRKTIFIEENSVSLHTSENINAKIGNLTSLTDDVNDFDKVLNKINNEINRLDIKYEKGETFKLKEKLNTLNEKIVDEEEILKNIGEKEAEKAYKMEELQELNIDIKSEMDERTCAENWNKHVYYEGLVSKYDTLENEYLESKNKFILRIPYEKEVKDNLEKLRKANAKFEVLKIKLLSDDEFKTYIDGTKQFVNGTPKPSEVEGILEVSKELNDDRIKFNALSFSDAERSDYEALKADYDKEGLKDKIKGYIDELGNLANAKAKGSTGKILGFLFLAISILAGLGGLILGLTTDALTNLTSTNGLLTILLLSFFVILLIVAIVLLCKNKVQKNPEILNEIRDFVNEYSLPVSDNDILNSLYELKTNEKKFRELRAKAENKDYEVFKKKIKDKEERIVNFLGKYNEKADISDLTASVFKFKAKVEAYKDVLSKKNEVDKTLREYQTLLKPVTNFLSFLGFTDDRNGIQKRLEKILTNVREYKKNSEAYLDIKKERERFEKKNNLDDVNNAIEKRYKTDIDYAVSLDKLNTNRDRLKDYISDIDRVLRGYFENMDDIKAKKLEISKIEKDIDIRKEKYRRLVNTREFLTTAKNNFTDRYTVPLMTGFRKYYELIEGDPGLNFTFDVNTNLLIEDHGSIRPVESYSIGTRDKMSLCFRMALVESMYHKEKPFIIMDDPFTNLDDNRLMGAKTAVTEIAKDYQILYLTCHDSRKLD